MVQLYMISQGTAEEIKKPIFTTGDAYLVVNKEKQMVYIWLGSKCSVDEKGTAAVEARRIDDTEFAGNAKIVTYDQGDEAAEFLAQLDGLRIVDKNLAKSMFKDVKTGEFAGQENFVNALYRVSSEEFEGDLNAMKFVQVDFKKESLDSEDVFIADLGTDIYVWIGKTANSKERAKAIQIARQFDAERSGAQKPVVFEEGEDAKFMEIFTPGFKAKSDRETVDFKAETFDEKPEVKEEPLKTPEPVKVAEPAKVPELKKQEEPVKAPVQSGPTIKEMPKQADGMLVQKGEGRLQCPKCGNTMRNMIRESEDRTRIIDTYLGLYGKKYHCGKCGAVWKREEN
jgi:ribosomal protein S27AE